MAREYDDALSFERDGDNIRLIGTIANAAAHVPAGSLVDIEAGRRTSSIYIRNAYIPMLPPPIVAQASLLPGKERLAITVEMLFDSTGKLLEIEPYESIIKSAQAFTYAGAEKARRSRTHPLSENLNIGLELARLLYLRRRTNGSLDRFDRERDHLAGEDGIVRPLHASLRYYTYLLVQEAMVQINSALPVHLAAQGCQVLLYRNCLQELEVSPRSPYATSFGKLVAASGGYRIPQRSLNGQFFGTYSPENAGHLGLVTDAYSHFTSPLRRYPDIAFQRILLQYLRNARSSALEIREEHQRLAELGRHCTTQPRKAYHIVGSLGGARKLKKLSRHKLLKLQPAQFRTVLTGALITKDPKIPALLHVATERKLRQLDIVRLIQNVDQHEEVIDFLIYFFKTHRSFDFASVLCLLAKEEGWKACEFVSFDNPTPKAKPARRVIVRINGDFLTTRKVFTSSSDTKAERNAARHFLQDYLDGNLVKITEEGIAA